MSDWISLDIELPKHLSFVLIAVVCQYSEFVEGEPMLHKEQVEFIEEAGYMVMEAMVFNSKLCGFSFREPTDEDKNILERYPRTKMIVTHWMPLPKNPFEITDNKIFNEQ